MDEIFGRHCYLGTFVWKTRNTDNRVKSRLSVDHEQVLVYSRTREKSIFGRFIDRSDFRNPDDDPRGVYVTDPLTGKATAEDRPNLHYDMVNEETGDVYSDCGLAPGLQPASATQFAGLPNPGGICGQASDNAFRPTDRGRVSLAVQPKDFY